MLLVSEVWEGWVRMQVCVAKRGSSNGLREPNPHRDKMQREWRSQELGSGVTKEGEGEKNKTKPSSGGWGLPLQVDNLYSRGWIGELRGVRGKGVTESNRERGGEEGEREQGAEGVLQVLWWRGGVAQRKHSNRNQQDLVLNFSFVCMVFCFSLYVWTPQALRHRDGWPWFYPNTTLHTFVSIPELFCCTCEQAERERKRGSC